MKKIGRLLYGMLLFYLLLLMAGSEMDNFEGAVYAAGEANALQEEEVLDAFLQLGCGVEQIFITGWGMKVGEELEISALALWSKRAISFLELHNDTIVYDITDGDKKQVKTVVIEKDFEISLVWQHGINNINGLGVYETYLVIDASFNMEENGPGDHGAIKERIENYLDAHMDSSRVSVTYSTTWAGSVPDAAVNGLSNHLFGALGARVVEGIQSDLLISTTGYTPRLAQRYQTEKGPVNLNFAIRYNPLTDKSYLWLGTPLIDSAY